ncbi:Annexin A8 [Echinococcus granulosus]|uniref:Annexin n=1 Tax=Echinococcus granulosus TaxID=6210 RepID=A0A068WUR8_ECHGR|nr:Annexin A8 [Echinococcus granulosus]CDS23892.1 annexin [Echinococcus granulosus]
MSIKVTNCGLPCNPTLRPYPNFNANSDVELLKKAMDGMGTDEAMIIEILGTRTSQQRVEIAEAYKGSYGEDLREKLQGELSGDFGELVDLMFYTIPELKAQLCYDAINGAGTDELALIEVICTSTNSEIEELKKEYAKVCQNHGKAANENSLEKDVVGDTSGYFKRILVALLAAQRHEPTEQQLKDIANRGIDSIIDKKAAEADAQKLYDAGEKRLGTDEEAFITILCTRSPWQLIAISKAYEKISKLRLVEAIASETKGDFRRALLTTLLANTNTPMAFAEHFNDGLSGAGTNDDQLMRLIVWRSEVDMKEIKNCYLTRYNRDLVDDIKDDTSGDYEKLLVRLLGSQ